MKSTIFAAAIAAALAVGATPASATLLTFEDITAMPNVIGLAVPVGSQLSTQYLGLYGVRFSSDAGYAAVVDHGFPALTPSPPNIIAGTNANGTLNYSALITASFFDPANSGTLATTNHVRVLGELFGLGSGTVTMTAYNQFGAVLGSVTDVDNYPLGQGPVLELNLAGIQRVTFSGTSGTVGFDNFEFNAVNAVTVVPEPASWAMMIGGLGLLGAALRRRRSLALA